MNGHKLLHCHNVQELWAHILLYLMPLLRALCARHLLFGCQRCQLCFELSELLCHGLDQRRRIQLHGHPELFHYERKLRHHAHVHFKLVVERNIRFFIQLIRVTHL